MNEKQKGMNWNKRKKKKDLIFIKIEFINDSNLQQTHIIGIKK